MKNKNQYENMLSETKSISSPNRINTVVEIPAYAPNQGLVPKEYQISGQLVQLEKTFKNRCMEFLNQGRNSVDEYNSTYMDAVIERICIDAVKQIRVQRCDHVYSIKKLLNDMHNGDYVKCVSKLKDFKRDKETNRNKFNKYAAIYYRGTSLAEEGGKDYEQNT